MMTEGALAPEVLESERELIVMTRPQTGLRATAGGLESARDLDVTPLTDLLAAEGVTLEPLFGESEERLILEAAELAPTADEAVPELHRFYRVPAEDDRLDKLAERLLELETIDAAYVKAAPELAAAAQDAGPVLNDMPALEADAPPATANLTPRQDYLDPAPVGIDAAYAWGIAGGRGAGIGIIDIEGAWRFSHEDLRQGQGGVIGGTQSTSLKWRGNR